MAEDRIPVGQTGSNYQNQILGTDEDGYVRKVRVDQDGELMVELSNTSAPYSDKYGRQNFNGLFGEKFVAHRKPTLSANFSYTADTRKFSQTQLNGGAVVRDENLLGLSSGTQANGEATIQSKENLRYVAGRDGEAMFTVRFDPPVSGNTRRYGLYDTNNGFYIGYENLDFGFSIRKNGVNTFIPQSSWNKDKCDGTGTSGFLWDKTKMNLVRMQYGYLGVMTVTLEVYAGLDIGWVLCHAYDVGNVTISTHINLPYLPIRASNRNNGNTTDVRMYSASTYCGSVDGASAYDSSSREFARKASFAAVTAGTDKPLIIFHNKATFSGIENKINDQLLRVGVGVEGTKPVLITLYKLAVTPTGTSFSDVDAVNSNMEVSTVGTINLTGAEMLMSWALGKSSSINDDVLGLNMLLFPNEYAVFTYTSTGTSDLEFSNRWSEQF